MSQSPSRRLKRAVKQAVERDQKKRLRNVNRLETWIRKHPNDPLALKLKLMKRGLVVAGETPGMPKSKPKREPGVRKSGLIIPPGTTGVKEE